MSNHFHLVVETSEANLAARLRRETTLTVGWMASRLHLGTRKSAALKLHRWGNGKQKAEPDQDETMV